MALRPYAAAKRTLSAAEKLAEMNWGLVLLICMIAIAGIAMLYSVASASFHPWAIRQIGHFTLGLLVMVAAAMIDIPKIDQASGTARKTNQPTPIETTRAA